MRFKLLAAAFSLAAFACTPEEPLVNEDRASMTMELEVGDLEDSPGNCQTDADCASNDDGHKCRANKLCGCDLPSDCPMNRPCTNNVCARPTVEEPLPTHEDGPLPDPWNP